MADSPSLKDVYEISWDLTSFNTGIAGISGKYNALLKTIGQSTTNIGSSFKSLHNVIAGSSGNTFEKMQKQFMGVLDSLKQIDQMGAKFTAGNFVNGMQQMGKQIDTNKMKVKEFITQMQFMMKYGKEGMTPTENVRYTAQLQKAITLLKELDQKQKEFGKTANMALKMDASKSIKSADEATLKLQKDFGNTIAKMKENIGNIKFTKFSDIHSLGDNQKRLNKAKEEYASLEKLLVSYNKKVETLENERNKTLFERAKTTDIAQKALLKSYYDELTEKITELKNKQRELISVMPANVPNMFTSKQQEINQFSSKLFTGIKSSEVADVNSQLSKMEELYKKIIEQSGNVSRTTLTSMRQTKDEILKLEGVYRANTEKIIEDIRAIKIQGRGGFISPEVYEEMRAHLQGILAEYDKFKPTMTKMASSANSAVRSMGNEVSKSIFRRFTEGIRNIRWQTVSFVYLISRAIQGFKSLFTENIDKVEEFRQSVFKLTAEFGMYSAIGLKKSFDGIWNYSYQLLERLRDVSSQSLASFEDLQRITKVFAQKGIFPNTDQDFKHIATIGTAIKVLTEGATASGFKMEKEIRDVLTGITRPTDRLQQSFLMMGINLRKTLDEAKAKGIPTLTALADSLKPYAELNKKIGEEYSTQEKRLGNIWDKIKQIALEPVIAELATSLTGFTNSLQSVGGELTNRGQALVNLMSSIYESVKQIIFSVGIMVTSVIGAIFGFGNSLYEVFMSAWTGIEKSNKEADNFVIVCNSIGAAAKVIGKGFEEAGKAVHDFLLGHKTLESMLEPLIISIGTAIGKAIVDGLEMALKNIPMSTWLKLVSPAFVLYKGIEETDWEHLGNKDKKQGNKNGDYTGKSGKLEDIIVKIKPEVDKPKFADAVKYMNSIMLPSSANEEYNKLMTQYDSIINKSKVGMEKINAVYKTSMKDTEDVAAEVYYKISFLQGMVADIKAKGGSKEDLETPENFLKSAWQQLTDILALQKAFGDIKQKSTEKFNASKEEQLLSAQKLKDSMTGKYLGAEEKALIKYKERLTEINAMEERFVELTGKHWDTVTKKAELAAALEERNRNIVVGNAEETDRMNKYREQLLGGVEGEVNKAIAKFMKIKSDIQLQLLKGQINSNDANQMNSWANQAQTIEVAKAQADQMKHLNDETMNVSSAYADLLSTSKNYYDNQNAQLIKLGISWEQYKEKIKAAELEVNKIYGQNSDQALNAIKMLQAQSIIEQQVTQEKMIEIMNPFFTSLKEMTQKWGDQLSTTLSNIITGSGYDRTKFRSRMDWIKQEFAKTLQDMNKQMINNFIKKAVMDPLMGSFGGKSKPGAGVDAVNNPLGFGQSLAGSKMGGFQNLTPINGGLPVYIMGASGTTSDSIFKTTSGDANILDKTQQTTAQTTAMTSTIKQIESGGDYNAKSPAGAYGAYQMLPSTFSMWAKQAGLGANAPMTPDNQDTVANYEVSKEFGQGYSPQQILTGWYTGDPNSKLTTGTGSSGVPYNVPAYVNKGMGIYDQNLTSSGLTNSISSTNSLSYNPYSDLYPNTSLTNPSGLPLANTNAIPSIGGINGLTGGNGTPVFVTNWPSGGIGGFSTNIAGGGSSTNIAGGADNGPALSAAARLAATAYIGSGPRPLGGIGTSLPNGTPEKSNIFPLLMGGAGLASTLPKSSLITVNGGNAINGGSGGGSDTSIDGGSGGGSDTSNTGFSLFNTPTGPLGYGSMSNFAKYITNGASNILSAPFKLLGSGISSLFGGSDGGSDASIGSASSAFGMDNSSMPSINAGNFMGSMNIANDPLITGDMSSSMSGTMGDLTSLFGGTADLAFADGGWIEEPVAGVGLNSGKKYTFGENGRELVSPQSHVGADNSTTHVHMPINLSAIDTQSGASFLQKHSSVIQNQVVSAINSNKKIRNSIKTASY